MGWKRRQTEGDRGSRRPRARQSERQHLPEPQQGTVHDVTFWQRIGIGEYEVGQRGYTGRSRMAGS